MKLSADQQESVIKKLYEYQIKCAICNTNNWNLSSVIHEIREFHGGSMVVGGANSIMPVVSLVCRKCGNTYMLNAIHLGFVKVEQNEEEEDIVEAPDTEDQQNG